MRRKPRGYWTKERCAEAAARFEHRLEFQNEANYAYQAAYRRGWLDDICRHMTNLHNHHGYWTKERITEMAAQYATRTQFKDEHSYAYEVARSNEWLEDIFLHIPLGKKPCSYWIHSRVIKESEKYTTFTDFREKSRGAYKAAWRNGWLTKIKDYYHSLKSK